MWRPVARQWVAIWVGFLTAGLCFVQGSGMPYRYGGRRAAAQLNTLGVLLIVATALVVWMLQPRSGSKRRSETDREAGE